jgi:hypothetical protein
MQVCRSNRCDSYIFGNLYVSQGVRVSDFALRMPSAALLLSSLGILLSAILLIIAFFLRGAHW